MSARVLVIVIAAGGALTLAFPEPDLAPIAWVALTPLLVAARGRSAGRGALLGFTFGLAFFGTLLYWISIVGWVAWGILVVLQAAFLALFGAGWALAARLESVAARTMGVASLWVAVEYLRSLFPLGGFTWGQLAQSQHNVGWILKAAGIGGAWLVAFILVAANALVAEAWLRARATDRDMRRAAIALAAALIVLLLPALFPAYGRGGDALEVAIVQGNVPRAFPGSVYEKELAIIASHERLTKDLAGTSVDLVVWPESSVGIDALHDPNARAALRRSARAVGVPLIVGANLDMGEDLYEVVALHISPEGETVDVYRKTHLVPFGEYVPARDALDWIPMLDQVPRDAVPGKEKTLFEIRGAKVAPVISFEGDFGSLVRGRIASGGRLLIVATNTSTWGESWASAQHVAMSQVRAAENGVPVVHAAISGISALVEPDGSIAARTPLWTAATLTGEVQFSEEISLYARTGDWLAVVALVAGAVLALSGLLTSRKGRRAPAGDVPEGAPRTNPGGRVPPVNSPSNPPAGRALVITPTYNESANIREAIARLDAAAGDRVDHLVIDDGSPDGTADVVRELARGRDDLHLLQRPEKQGLGTAYVTGFRWGLARGYGAFVEMDADLSHDPADVPRLLDALEDADLVIGSRYVPGGNIENWSKARQWLSQSGNIYARTLLSFGVRDSTSGYRAYRAEILDRMNLDDIRSEGYAFQIEMTHLVHQLEGRIVEIPITFVERVAGKSKMSRRIIAEALASVTRWGLRTRRGSRR